MAQARIARAINRRGKTRVRIYSAGREASSELKLADRTVEYGPQNWPIAALVPSKRYNKYLFHSHSFLHSFSQIEPFCSRRCQKDQKRHYLAVWCNALKIFLKKGQKLCLPLGKQSLQRFCLIVWPNLCLCQGIIYLFVIGRVKYLEPERSRNQAVFSIICQISLFILGLHFAIGLQSASYTDCQTKGKIANLTN